MKFSRGHWLLKLGRFDHPAEKLVRVEEHRIIEEDVIDTHDLFIAQHDIRSLRVAFVHRQTDAKVRVVIKVCAGGDYPVDEAGLDQRNQSGHTQARGRQSAGQGYADSNIRLQHFLREEPTRFAQAGSVIGQESTVNQVSEFRGARNWFRIDPPATQKFALFLCQDFPETDY